MSAATQAALAAILPAAVASWADEHHTLPDDVKSDIHRARKGEARATLTELVANSIGLADADAGVVAYVDAVFAAARPGLDSMAIVRGAL